MGWSGTGNKKFTYLRSRLQEGKKMRVTRGADRILEWIGFFDQAHRVGTC